MPKTLISLFLKSSISVLSVLSTQLASAETTLVAVASNFIQPAQALVDAFNSQQKTQQKNAKRASGPTGLRVVWQTLCADYSRCSVRPVLFRGPDQTSTIKR